MMSRQQGAMPSLSVWRRHRAARSTAALLGILGLMLQLCLPLVRLPMEGTPHRPAAPLWLAGAICTVSGKPLPANGGTAPLPRKASICPICLALSLGGSVVLPAIAALITALAVGVPLPLKPALLPRVGWLGLAALPRAPPVTA